MEATLVIMGVLGGLSFRLTGWAQEYRGRKGKRMPEMAAQIFGTILCAELFYLLATIENMFACGSWQGCDDLGAYWAGLQEVLGSIPATPELIFWIIFASQLLLCAVMAKIDRQAASSAGEV